MLRRRVDHCTVPQHILQSPASRGKPTRAVVPLWNDDD